ncbi:MAG: peptidase T [Treponemataceae bacterium]|nr:MAG: peptidase T [Treponemataceae bacterium]
MDANHIPNELSQRILERFLRYVKIWTTSDRAKADAGIIPSTPQQRDFAELLATELKALGADDVHVTEFCYVCARIPANVANADSRNTIAFLAHLDTVDSVPGKNVNPQVVRKNGETFIVSDGTTLLGADDKAGIAEIMTLAELLLTDASIPHGDIEIIFPPDEETGHGMDKVPLDWMRAKQAYTLDGDDLGALEAECFNAYKSTVVFTGHAEHTGHARPNMVNAINLAADFVNMLPRHESPETTDERMGFYTPVSVHAEMESATVELFLRDFDAHAMEKRMRNVETFAQAVCQKYAGVADDGKAALATVSVTHTLQYKNMAEKMSEQAVQKLVAAMAQCAITPRFKPIRGGTDGSRLTEIGIPTPNIFTGANAFHSRGEWACLEQMTKAVEVLVALVKLWT